MQKTVKILCEESLFCDTRTDTDQKLRTYFMFKLFIIFRAEPHYLADSFSFCFGPEGSRFRISAVACF